MKKAIIFLIIAITNIHIISGQESNNLVAGNQGILDFLNIPADSRSAGMGDVGIATSPDNYSHYFNPSKQIFLDSVAGGLSLSYTPWMRKLVNDMYIAALSGYYIINGTQSISASFRYFALGEMDLRDDWGDPTGKSNPYQLSLDVAYARKLAEHLSASVTFRYLLSDIYPNDIGYNAGWGIAADVGLFFNKEIRLFGQQPMLGAGFSLSNLGTKVSYTDNISIFMPMMLRFGASIGFKMGKENRLMVSTDIGRSLVPTEADHLNSTAMEGMFNAFSEGVFKSMKWGIGAEYSLKDYLFGRAGYYNESRELSNRKYLSFGIGLAYKATRFDFAYLVPTGNRQNAMGNTLRLSLSFSL